MSNNGLIKRSLSNLLPTNKKTWDFYRSQIKNEEKIIETNRLLNEKIEENEQQDKQETIKTINFINLSENENDNSEIKLEKSITSLNSEKFENIDKIIENENDCSNKFNEFEEDHEEEDENLDNEDYEYKTIKMFSSDTENLGQMSYHDFNYDRENTDQILVERKRAKNSKEILAGITKRVVMADTQHLKKLSKDFIRKYNSIDTSNDEKGHIIEPVDLKSNYNNYKFRRSNQNKKIREIEYNQLLECLSKIFIFLIEKKYFIKFLSSY